MFSHTLIAWRWFFTLSVLGLLASADPVLAAPPSPSQAKASAAQGVQIGDLALPRTLAAKSQERISKATPNSASQSNTGGDALPATRPPLSDAAIGDMLDNMGLAVTRETATDGTTIYSFVSKSQTWTVPIKVQLGPDKEYLWWKASIVVVDDSAKLTADQWESYLLKNASLAPAGFCVMADNKMLTLLRVERNQNISPQLARQWIDDMTENVISSYSLWQPLTVTK